VSITGTDSQVVYRPFTSQGDPTLPDQMWVAGGSVEGDGSGGDRIVVLEFKGAGVALATAAFSLEYVTVTSLAPTARTLEIVSSNMDFILGLPANNQYLGFADLEDLSANQAIMAQDKLKLPAYLGIPRSTALAATLTFTTANENLISLVVHASGYRWGGAAFLAPGGPRRPANSIYGN